MTEDEELELLTLERERSMGGGQEQAPPSMMGKAWNALAVPEQMSRQGLGQLAGMVPQPEPTGNLPMDLLKGAPRIAADTMAEAAPGFVSRGSILGAAAAPALGMAGKGIRALAKPAGRWMGEQAEGMAGMIPGALREAYNNAGAIFAKGKKAASPFYEEGKLIAEGQRPSPTSGVFDKSGVFQSGASAAVSEIEQLREVAKAATDHRTLFDAASKLDKLGSLEPDIALAARKSMWKIKKSIPDDRFYTMLSKFNKVIKENPAMAKGDEMFQKGLMAESLRSLFPKTAQGKPSSWKTMMAGLSGPIGAVASPLALGAGSTGAGLVGRKLISPMIDAPMKPVLSAVALLQAMRKKNND